MAKIVVYGGTFNPIHSGHVSLCRFVTETCGYDKILLIPAAMPPHKDAPLLADGQYRLAMCRLATASLPQASVLDWEILQGGKSYTIDTLRWLGKQYPGDTFFLLMGSDMFLTFCQWRDWQGIGRLATLLVASREADDHQALAVQQETLAGLGIAANILENPVMLVSSTQVRQEIAETGGSSLLPPAVAGYIREHRLYPPQYDLAALRAMIQPLQEPGRYRHSLCVAERAAELAKKHGADANQAAAAGLLHDICKNMTKERLLQMLPECDTIAASDIDFMRQPQLLHSYAGAVYLRQEKGISDDDLLNAVRYHTTGRAGMSRLEKIIYLADLTSSERRFPESAHLRELSDNSLEAGMLWSLAFMAEVHLPAKGTQVCKDTQAALAEYRSRLIKESNQ